MSKKTTKAEFDMAVAMLANSEKPEYKAMQDYEVSMTKAGMKMGKAIAKAHDKNSDDMFASYWEEIRQMLAYCDKNNISSRPAAWNKFHDELLENGFDIIGSGEHGDTVCYVIRSRHHVEDIEEVISEMYKKCFLDALTPKKGKKGSKENPLRGNEIEAMFKMQAEALKASQR